MTKFIILFSGRSGSSYLKSVLNAHPDVHCDGEFSYRTEDQLSELENVHNFDFQASGLKVRLIEILDRNELLKYMYTNNVKLIHLYRDNIIKHTLSRYIAVRVLHKKRGIYNITNKKHRVTPLTVDLFSFLNDLITRLEVERDLHSFCVSYENKIQIKYEDLCISKPIETLEKIQSFLGVEILSLETDMKKTVPDDIRLAVKNYDQLKGFIKFVGINDLADGSVKIFDRYFE